MILMDFMNKKVYCKTFSGRVYEGVVKEVEFLGNNTDGKPIYLISIYTKFDQLVGFNSLDLKFIEEEKR